MKQSNVGNKREWGTMVPQRIHSRPWWKSAENRTQRGRSATQMKGQIRRSSRRLEGRWTSGQRKLLRTPAQLSHKVLVAVARTLYSLNYFQCQLFCPLNFQQRQIILCEAVIPFEWRCFCEVLQAKFLAIWSALRKSSEMSERGVHGLKALDCIKLAYKSTEISSYSSWSWCGPLGF